MKIILFLCIGAMGSAAGADHYVSGYTRKDGTQVQGHYKSDSNGTRNDNYSTVGNINLYTGSHGTKPNDEQYQQKKRGY